MPDAKINVLEGQYDKDRLSKASSAIQNALIVALGIPAEGLFQIFYMLPRCQFLPTPSFLASCWDSVPIGPIRARPGAEPTPPKTTPEDRRC
jgi:hypothetical protein